MPIERIDRMAYQRDTANLAKLLRYASARPLTLSGSDDKRGDLHGSADSLALARRPR